jgi:uncharacterized protein (TIGR00299 family) protein
MTGWNDTALRSKAPMRQAYLDCFSGASGNMLLGAIIDAGWPLKELEALPARLGIGDTTIAAEYVMREGLRGLHIAICSGAQPLRTIRDIEDLLGTARLAPGPANRCLQVFKELAQAEARIHGCPIEQIHFHELGAVDTIVDVAGVVSGLTALDVTQITCSPLPVSRGWVKCEHGLLPLPAPACSELLRGMPVYGVEGNTELVTPTGAALLKVLADEFGPLPEMALDRVGYGAGSREIPGRANLLRIWIGEEQAHGQSTSIVELKTHIDDMNPEWYEYLMERLFNEGALDVAIAGIQMKKNRPGVALTILAPPGWERRLSEILFEASTTTGIRVNRCQRYTLPRQSGYVRTQWGNVRAKLITRPNGHKSLSPEYESCKRIASTHNVPLSAVYQAVSQTPVENFAVMEKSNGRADATPDTRIVS